jgi:hypothetical protein
MAPPGHDREDPEAGTVPGGGTELPSDRSVAVLRGPPVEVDVRRVAHFAVGLALTGLAVVAGVLFMAGYQKNSQIDDLRAHGVPVELTVTHCLGLMGGSGSNLAGYACSGTYTVAGHVFTEDIPGNTLHAPGTTVRGVIVPGDPALFSTPATVASEHASWTVYLVPAVLLALLALLLGLVAARMRHRSSS